MKESLLSLVNQWKDWSHTNHAKELKNEFEGWEGCFPRWKELIFAASQKMTKDSILEDDFKNIEFCWIISEETEEMSYFAKEELKDCWETVLKLSKSEKPKVRWQAYEVLKNSESGLKILENILINHSEKDEYCKKRLNNILI